MPNSPVELKYELFLAIFPRLARIQGTTSVTGFRPQSAKVSPHSHRKQQMLEPNMARCDAFWERRDVDRPLLTSWIGSYEVAKLYPEGLSQLPTGQITPGDFDFEFFRADYERLFEQHCSVDVDVPWVAMPVMVVPWLEAIAGCPIHHRDGNVWAKHWLDSYEQLDQTGLQPDPNWLEKLAEFTQWLVRLSDGRFPVALSLMRGPADLLSAVRGAEYAIYDLYDVPGRVEGLLNLLTDLWIEAAQAQMAQIPKFADGYCFSIQQLWSRQRGGWFQDDAIAYWSPELYAQFARPCETRLSNCMPRTGIHLHGPALFTVDHLVDMPDLDIIEVNLDDVGLKIPDMIPRSQQILEKKRLFVWGAFTDADLHMIREHLPARGLALQPIAETPSQMQALSHSVRTLWG